MLKRTWATLAVVASLGLGSANADTLQMTDTPQARDVVSRGLSMAQVEHRYGEPARRIGAIGDPPISRWVYPGFVVYFEGQFVIHAVSTKPAS